MKSWRLDKELWIEKAGVPKETLHIMLCYLLKRQLAHQKLGLPIYRTHFKIITRRHCFKMKNHIILIHPLGTAWCLLKTQYAKKPKNPV